MKQKLYGIKVTEYSETATIVSSTMQYKAHKTLEKAIAHSQQVAFSFKTTDEESRLTEIEKGWFVILSKTYLKYDIKVIEFALED